MSASLIEKVIKLENSDELHCVRLLILIYTLTGKKDGTTIYITKLAKLDFILRYPVVLDKALSLLNIIKKSSINEAQRNSIESEMLAFSYSPWSSNFRRLLVLLSSRNLIVWRTSGRQIELSSTEVGRNFYRDAIEHIEFREFVQQSKVIKTNFSNLPLTKLDSLMLSVIKDISTFKEV
jgi:hypothetical protein